MNRYLKAGLLVAILAPIVVLQGQACSPMQSAANSSLSSTSGSNTGVSEMPGVPLPESELKSRETMRMVHSRELLTSTMSILNQPYSNATYTIFSQVGSNLSDDGYTDGVSAPMMNSLLSINGTACSSAIANEKNLPDDQRVIFKGFVFTKAPTAQSASATTDLVRVLARRAWLRSETPTELAMIVNDAKVFDTAVVDDTTKKALFICSAMLTSLEAVAR